MRKNIKRTFKIVLVILCLGSSALAAKKDKLLKDLDSLGSNQGIAERAKAIDGQNRVRVVQNRTVDRDLRVEVGFSYDAMTGGDSYVNSNNVGYMIDFHINPRVSVGARYYDAYSELSSEGERVFKEAQNSQNNTGNFVRPDVDFPLSTAMGVVTFYPLYGKLNFFNIGVTQFDVYMLGGYGQMKLQSGSSSTWTAGGGVGIWWSQHLTSRVEARYQRFQDEITSGTRDQGVTSFSVGIGFLL